VIGFLVEPFRSGFMQRALIEMVVLSILCSAAGTLVLIRRLPFIADALSHTVFPGVAIAFAAGSSLFLGALAAAALASVLLAVTTRQKRLDPDALMALLIASFFSVGVIVVSRQRSFNADLTALLFGRLLTVDAAAIVQSLAVLAVVAVVMVLSGKELVLLALDPDGARAMGYRVGWLDLLTISMVAMAVVASARAVGTALVITLIVTPAATARILTDRLGRVVAVATVVSIVGGWLGLAISYDASVHHDIRLAPGATITLVLTTIFIAAWVVHTLAQRWVPSKAALVGATS
jgi:manganese/iron transport system permease protein